MGTVTRIGMGGLVLACVACQVAVAKPVVTGDFAGVGGIVVLPEIDDPPSYIPGTPAEIDIDGDGVLDFRVSALVTSYSEQAGVCENFGLGLVTALNGGAAWECNDDWSEFIDFDNGPPVGPVLPPNYGDPDIPLCPILDDVVVLYSNSIIASDFYDDAGGTVGFRFVRDGQTHWGWIHIVGTITECFAVAPTVLSYGYETTPDMPVLPKAATCHDLTGDTIIDSADLNVLLAGFGDSDAGDLDGDGLTGSSDLNLLLTDFGETCEALGSCCVGGECEHLTIDDCVDAGGTFVGNQISCEAAACD
jgi:hypothetical protein